MGESQVHFSKWKKPDFKSYTLFGSMYMTFWKRHSYRHGEQISGCQELRDKAS